MSDRQKRNSYYTQMLDELHADKDSIFEMAKIISYDRERLVARVFTLTSKQYRDDVPVLFPSMYFNTGIISPPMNETTAILFWGPERQAYLLPIQLTLPKIYSENGEMRLTASPGVIDEVLSLRNIQGGEHLIRSAGGAYAFFKNAGDVEIGTSLLHRFGLSQQTGEFELMADRIREEISNGRRYFGPASMDSHDDKRTFYYFEFEERTDTTEQIVAADEEEFLEKILKKDTGSIQFTPKPRIYIQQMGHVFNETGETLSDDVDGAELFSKEEFAKDGVKQTKTLSKAGRKTILTQTSESQTTLSVSPEEVSVTLERIVGEGVKKTEIALTKDGKIVCGEDDKKYDLLPMLKWFYEERTK
ncbi:hypothetical protein AAXE64_27540 [Priestia megaterium]